MIINYNILVSTKNSTHSFIDIYEPIDRRYKDILTHEVINHMAIELA